MTTREVLKQTGLTDEQIDALDAKAISAFDSVVAKANADREAAELAQRAQNEMYEQKIAPALDSWGIEKTSLEAERDFYRTQAQGAKSAGFIPKEAPGFTPPADRAPNGQFVAGANPVPGSPAIDIVALTQNFTEGISNAHWVDQQHMALYGSPAPDEFFKLSNEAKAQHLQFRDYADRKYKFSEKRTEIAKKNQDDHDKKIREDAIKERDKHWAERAGNNPMVREGTDSQYSKVKEAVSAGKRGDPLKMTAEQRRTNTRQIINSEIADHAANTVN